MKRRPSTRCLYHFTSAENFSRILTAQVLRTTESNLSPRRAHAGPDVVWLTTSPIAEGQTHGLNMGWGKAMPTSDKRRVRITIRTSAIRWREWAAAHGMDLDGAWARRLTAVGGSSSWWVTEREVPATDWLEVRDMATGEVLWSHGSQVPTGTGLDVVGAVAREQLSA